METNSNHNVAHGWKEIGQRNVQLRNQTNLIMDEQEKLDDKEDNFHYIKNIESYDAKLDANLKKLENIQKIAIIMILFNKTIYDQNFFIQMYCRYTRFTMGKLKLKKNTKKKK